MEAKREPDDKFKYLFIDILIVSRSTSSRMQIDREKALADRNLELAYTERPEDIYFMQVQVPVM
ncbi:MAG: hypothetical protein R2769_04665 [Saprospiraceae bacterium]